MISQVLQVRTCTQGVTTELLTCKPSLPSLLTVCSSPHAPWELSTTQAAWKPVYPVEDVECRWKEVCRMMSRLRPH